jgi:hypothetical protein
MSIVVVETYFRSIRKGLLILTQNTTSHLDVYGLVGAFAPFFSFKY